MKVAIVGPIPPPNGGMAMQTQQLIRLLEKAGLEVTHIATNSPYRPDFIANIPVVRALFRLVRYFFTLLNSLKNVQIIHLMANSGWSFYLFAMPVIYIASWNKVPVIMNYRGGLAAEFFDRDWRWIKGAVQRVDKIIVPSGFLKGVFAQYGVNSTIIPNIVDLSIFDYHPVQLNKESLHIVITRNLEAIYDNKTAIEGFALFAKNAPQSRLSIAGSGELEDELKALVATLGISDKVSFVGRLSREDIAALYQSADILLNTSLVDNTPNSIIEALACGLVVVSSDVGGIPYLVTDNQHAYLMPPQSKKWVAKRLNSVIEQPDVARRIARNGYGKVSAFTPNVVITKLISLYQESI